MTAIRVFALALVLCAIAPATGLATPGDLDPEFDRDGLRTVPPSGPIALAVGPDGASIVASEGASGFVLDRLEATGAHAGFIGGRAEVNVGGAVGPAAAFEPGGSLLVAGTSTAGLNVGDFVLARVVYASGGGSADPALASSLDGDGVAFVHLPSSGGNRLTSLSVAPGGGIAAAGIVAAPDGPHIGVARLQPDGTPQPGFGTDGLMTFSEGDGFGEDVAVAALPGGETLVAGAGPAPDGTGTGDLLVARLTATGAFDTSFGGGDGWLTIDVDGRDDARSLAVLGDGRIAVGFEVCAFGLHTGCRGAVAVLSADGVLDPSFGTGGLVDGLAGSEVADGGGGGILIAGATELREYFRRDFALTRLTPGGTLDAGFSGAGVARADFGLTEDRAAAIGRSPDGRPVLAGIAGEATGVARFEAADGPPDADADGRLDAADRCPLRFSRHRSGCPAMARELKLRKRGGRLEAKLKSELAPCVRRQKVRLQRLGKGRAKTVRRARTSRQGKAKLGRKPGRGRYQARVKVSIAPGLVRCEKDKSGVLRGR